MANKLLLTQFIMVEIIEVSINQNLFRSLVNETKTNCLLDHSFRFENKQIVRVCSRQSASILDQLSGF